MRNKLKMKTSHSEDKKSTELKMKIKVNHKNEMRLNLLISDCVFVHFFASFFFVRTTRTTTITAWKEKILALLKRNEALFWSYFSFESNFIRYSISGCFCFHGKTFLFARIKNYEKRMCYTSSLFHTERPVFISACEIALTPPNRFDDSLAVWLIPEFLWIIAEI